MPLPSGIVTKKLVISPSIPSSGGVASLEVRVVPSVDPVIWGATGEPISTHLPTVRTPPTQAAIIDLPATDQSGFVTTNQNPVTGWNYKITVRYLTDGRKTGLTVTKYYTPRTADADVIDFDLLPNGEAGLYQGPPGAPGAPGKSAYDIAVDHGFVGTEAEWLNSITNPSGSSGGSTHLGEGPPPDFIYGAKVKDIYIDTLSGALYELEEG